MELVKERDKRNETLEGNWFQFVWINNNGGGVFKAL